MLLTLKIMLKYFCQNRVKQSPKAPGPSPQSKEVQISTRPELHGWAAPMGRFGPKLYKIIFSRNFIKIIFGPFCDLGGTHLEVGGPHHSLGGAQLFTGRPPLGFLARNFVFSSFFGSGPGVLRIFVVS